MSDTQVDLQMISPSKGKFRISLSLAQIDWILANCKSDLPELHSQLTLIKFKAETGLTSPAYSLAPPREKKEKPLAIPKRLPMDKLYSIAVNHINANIPLTEELKNAYDEYRYLNDLMSESEADQYEKDALAIELGDMNGDMGESNESY